MKGVVFTELIEMIENECGLEVLDQVLEETKLSGIYTTVGDYPESELYALLDSLGKATGLSILHFVPVLGSVTVGSRFFQ